MVSLPQGRPRYQPGVPRRPKRPSDGLTFRDDTLLFGASFAVFLAAAVFFFFVLDVYNQDALSRTVDAHNVLFSRDPHLGAIGLVWPPIPTVMRIALMPLLSPVGLTEFTGPVTSVIATAGCVVLLNRILHRFRVPVGTRVTWIVLSFGNPVTLYHFVNGTAESVFSFFFLWVLLAALNLREAPERAVIGMGLAGGLALWVRYEALAILGIAVVGVLLISYVFRREGVWRDATRFESLLVTLLAPGIFLGLMWLSFNYSAAGDPLFFYRGPYSINAAPDVARNVADHALRYAYQDVFGTLSYIIQRALQVSFLFPLAVFGAAIVGLRRRAFEGTVLAMLSASTLLMMCYQTFTGTIAPWLRYWVYLPVFTPILLGWIAYQYPFWLRGTALAQTVRNGIIPAMFLLASAVSYQAMGHVEVGADEQLVVATIGGDETRAAALRTNFPDREVTERVMAALRETEGVILLDLQRAPVLVLHFEDAHRFAINTDRDFGQILDAPTEHADYVLLPDPLGKGVELQRDEIYIRYPDLYEGAEWLELVQEFRGEILDWLLFRVVDPPALPPAS